MNNDGIVNIHGKDYVTVAKRVLMAHENGTKKLSIQTEFLPTTGAIVCKATVTTDKGIFVGHSAANDSKMIEKQNPYEVAETSAVGRALGFAGYGVVEGIASADEMIKATATEVKEECKHDNGWTEMVAGPTAKQPGDHYRKCRTCGAFMGYIKKETVTEATHSTDVDKTLTF